MISDERAEKALRFLVDTDESAANLRGEMERAEFSFKRTREAVFSLSEGTVAERQAASVQHERTQTAHEAYVAAVQAYHFVANKRDTERITLDVFRTIQANRRVGSV